MPATLDMSQMPSSLAADANPLEPRSYRQRSAHHFLSSIFTMLVASSSVKSPNS
jgi:hypothetical protein